MSTSTQIVTLIVALLVVPWFVALSGRVRMSNSRTFFLASMVALYVSYFAAVLGGMFFESFFISLRYAAHGLAGILALLGAIHLRRDVLAERGQ